MVRTKSDAYTKAGGKAPRKTSIAKPSVKATKKKTSGGLNPICRRPVPKWQSPITDFLAKDKTKASTPTTVLISDDEEPTTGKQEQPSTIRNFDEPGTSAEFYEDTEYEETGVTPESHVEAVLKTDNKDSAGESASNSEVSSEGSEYVSEDSE